MAGEAALMANDRDRRLPRGEERQQQENEEASGSFVDQIRTNPVMGAKYRRWRKARSAAKNPAAAIPATAGAPLSDAVRTRMEPRLGADLSSVRVHAGSESAAAAEDMGARAFTVGNDVHFGAGEFAPGSNEGDKLLAHELTHTVQAQRSGIQRKASAESESGEGEQEEGVSQPGEPAELEADAVADHVADDLHGADAKKKPDAQKGGNATEKAPAIGAKLEGVGRKIFRAEDKNKTEASIKRLGNAGQDKQALKDALKKVQHERGACVEQLNGLKQDIGKLGLNRPQAEGVRGSLDTALNGIRDHLTDDDIAGAMRDAASDPVRKPGSGKTYDHLGEVNDGLAALQGARDTLIRVRRDLNRRQIDPKTVASVLDPALHALQQVIQRVEQAVKKVKP